MARKVWNLDLEDGPHTVELDHGYWSGRRTILVDGKLVHESKIWLDTGSSHAFEVSGHSCVVDIRNHMASFRYHLTVDVASRTAPSLGEEATETETKPRVLRPRRRPIWLVSVLTFVTGGIYMLFWAGATWTELKRELEDDRMRPVWHALSLLVPIYGAFQIYAHFRRIRDLVDAWEVGSRVNPWLGVAGLSVLSGNRTFRGASPELEATMDLLGVAIVGLTAAAVAQGQRALNASWDARPQVSASPGVRGREWLALGVGGLITAALIVINTFEALGL